jgi:hypothetical protein
MRSSSRFVTRTATRSTLTARIALGLAIAVAPALGPAQQTGTPPGPGHGHGSHGTQPAAKPAAKPATKPAVRPTPKPGGQQTTGTATAGGGRPSTADTPARADSIAAHAAHRTPRYETVIATPVAVDSTRPSPAVSGGTTVPAIPVHTPADHAAPASRATSRATSHASPHGTTDAAPGAGPHAMWMRSVGGGWSVMGMAQVFPTLTAGSPRQDRSLLRAAGVYATQPAVMANVASPDARFVLRTTLNFEELTQEHGELTFGGWGEGFIDSRHPHTLVHEAMLTANLWDVGGGTLSISAGKGFAPYGTDDPMGRPAVKFPTNHHLSQVLERFTANALYLKGGWGFEAGIFGGAEPKDAYDFSNAESFGDSWSARLSKRFGDGFGPDAPWELATSYARVEEDHHGKTAVTELFNTNVRHAQAHDFGMLYTMAEWSRSKPTSGRGHYAALGEALVGLGAGARHQPYARVEYATRPEYERKGAPGTPDFYRYDHDSHEIGATRWLIGTVGYGYSSSALPTSVRPYVELQRNTVRGARGDIDPRTLYGSREFWSVSAGARIFIGGGPMRMGSYGTLDPMTAPMRPRTGGGAAAHGAHGGD